MRFSVLVLVCSVLTLAAGPAVASRILPPIPSQSPHAIAKLEQLRAQYESASIDYLEAMSSEKARYIRPSEIDPRFTIALYVNVSGSGEHAQKMWVLQRDEIGAPWKLGLWDKTYWQQRGLPDSITPPYSWPVSTGRKYAGDQRSGPTPTGVFALDERKGRLIRGYGSPGMINVTFIDFHYRSGRRSGVAFHGTTGSKYRLLGSIDSHGCIRMTKSNALAVLNRLQGRDGVFGEEMRWGEIPRFWTHERGGNRYGYTRDGSLHYSPTAAMMGTDGDRRDDGSDLPAVLTKQGYRAIAIMFQD